ncbi:DUF4838 domain-containing protein [Treponema sp. TIM-1]|uniref:DUF4838 domain-containing protein n=1 Tax=Treponema sp. TIM-1 TaxID=2898417 RepID=UPI0039802096
MITLDVSKDWTILLPFPVKAARVMGEELSRCIHVLRKAGAPALGAPPVADALGPSPADSVPVVMLHCAENGGEKNGFVWRAGQDRIELFGDSPRGLCNGVYDFLKALGFGWPKPGVEETPRADPAQPCLFPLEKTQGHAPSQAIPAQRRMLLSGNRKNQEALIPWAARNRIDALVVPLEPGRLFFPKKIAPPGSPGELFRSLAAQYALFPELGGWVLSRLVPRRYFLFHRDFFRMTGGKRVKDYNFCPTSPETIRLIREEAAILFRSHPEVRVFHLWPDRGNEKTWCACPTCRAFTPEEQNRIAVNAAADVLLKINPQAWISYYEDSDDPGNIAVRPNMFPCPGFIPPLD